MAIWHVLKLLWAVLFYFFWSVCNISLYYRWHLSRSCSMQEWLNQLSCHLGWWVRCVQGIVLGVCAVAVVCSAMHRAVSEFNTARWCASCAEMTERSWSQTISAVSQTRSPSRLRAVTAVLVMVCSGSLPSGPEWVQTFMPRTFTLPAILFRKRSGFVLKTLTDGGSLVSLMQN